MSSGRHLVFVQHLKLLPRLDNQPENRLCLKFINFEKVGTRLSGFSNSGEMAMKKDSLEQ